MLKISRLADYATLIMVAMAREGNTRKTSRQIAAKLELAEPTASKLLKKLTNARLLVSSLGVQGGYALALSADEITVLMILEAIEGPLALTECNHHAAQCTREAYCDLSGHWRVINQALRTALHAVCLSDLCRDRSRCAEIPLEQVLSHSMETNHER